MSKRPRSPPTTTGTLFQLSKISSTTSTSTTSTSTSTSTTTIFHQNHQQEQHRFAFVTAYDGTAFHGWQRQPNADLTIQAYVEKRLSSLFGRPCNTIVNGRTDGGVHSNGTVFHLDLNNQEIQRVSNMYKSKPHHADLEKTYSVLDRTAYALQHTLRRSIRVAQLDIQIIAVYPVSNDFHARMSCIGKRYVYNIHEGFPMPLDIRACWPLHGKHLDVDLMNQVAELFVGVHDFSVFGRQFAFSSGQIQTRFDVRSPIRCLHTLKVVRLPAENDKNDGHDREPSTFGRIRIVAEADFFLWNMCRRLVGLLVQVGLHIVTLEEIQKHLGTEFKLITDNRIKQKFIATAPAKGLCLDQVFYNINGIGGDSTKSYTEVHDKKETFSSSSSSSSSSSLATKADAEADEAAKRPNKKPKMKKGASTAFTDFIAAVVHEGRHRWPEVLDFCRDAKGDPQWKDVTSVTSMKARIETNGWSLADRDVGVAALNTWYAFKGEKRISER